MNIKVLGTGCARCNSLEKTVKEAVKELGLNIEIEHVTDMKQIMQYLKIITCLFNNSGFKLNM